MAEKKKKKTAQGFTAKGYTPGLRKKGESFMDFTTRQHEQRYPGAQRMAREAGAGGFRAFTPAGAEYRRGIREEMPWLNQGQRYQSEDWKRMLANRQTGMYGGTEGTGAQVGGAPPGRPPLPTAMGNVLGGGQRPAIAPLQRKTAYMADPRNQAAAAAAQIRQTGGDASVAEGMFSSPRGIGQRYDFPQVNVPLGQHYSGPRRSSLLNRQQVGPPGQFTQPQLSMADLARMQTGAAGRDQYRENAFRATPVQVPMGSGRAPTGAAQLRSYPGQNYGATGAYLGQFPRYPASPAGSQLPYNVLGGQQGRDRQITGTLSGQLPRPRQQFPMRPGDPFPNLDPRYRPYQQRF